MRKKLFSERYGFIPEKKLQKNGLDEETRNRLWNILFKRFFDVETRNIQFGDEMERVRKYCYTIWNCYFKTPADQIPRKYLKAIRYIKDEVVNIQINQFKPFDLVEVILNNKDIFNYSLDIADEINTILEEEESVYRLFPETMQFAPIYHETDLKNLNDAFERTKSKYDSVYENLENALSAYSDRKENRYRESIVSSIKAVESMVNKISDKSNDKALTGIIESVGSKINMHDNLVNGLKELYNWSSDTLRHGKSDKPLEVREPEARYMLLSCSAFINYIISLYELH